MNTAAIELLDRELRSLFDTLATTQAHIRAAIARHADGKMLKGDEIVGWYGEVVVRTLLGGRLVHDREEHDVETPDGRRISVKTRKGFKTGWQQSSAIPKIAGATCPTHLAFVHLHDDFRVDRVWLFPWADLRQTNRFAEHIVRGEHRSYMFKVQDKKDSRFVIHPSSQPQRQRGTATFGPADGAFGGCALTLHGTASPRRTARRASHSRG